MAEIFDTFSYLDPVRANRQIEEYFGAPIFDVFSALDPARESKQIEAAFNESFFTVFSALDPVLAMKEISTLVAGEDFFHATNLTAHSPAVGGGAFHQKNVLTGSNLTTSSPVLPHL